MGRALLPITPVTLGMGGKRGGDGRVRPGQSASPWLRRLLPLFPSIISTAEQRGEVSGILGVKTKAIGLAVAPPSSPSFPYHCIYPFIFPMSQGRGSGPKGLLDTSSRFSPFQFYHF